MTHLSGGADLGLSPSFVSLHTLLIGFLFALQTAVHVRVGRGDTGPARGRWHRDSGVVVLQQGGEPSRNSSSDSRFCLRDFPGTHANIS